MDQLYEDIDKVCSVLKCQRLLAERREADEDSKKLAVKMANATKEKSRQHIAKYEHRQKCLDEIKNAVSPVTDSNDPEVKKIRIQIKKNIGQACNQISSTPSSIKMVVQNLCKLLDVSCTLFRLLV